MKFKNNYCLHFGKKILLFVTYGWVCLFVWIMKVTDQVLILKCHISLKWDQVLVCRHPITGTDCDILTLHFPNKRNHSGEAHHRFRTEVKFISRVMFALADHRMSPQSLSRSTLVVCFIVITASLINSFILILFIVQIFL